MDKSEAPPLTAELNDTAEQGGSLLDRLSHSSVLADLALDKFGCWECNHPCDSVTQCHNAIRCFSALDRSGDLGGQVHRTRGCITSVDHALMFCQTNKFSRTGRVPEQPAVQYSIHCCEGNNCNDGAFPALPVLQRIEDVGVEGGGGGGGPGPATYYGQLVAAALAPVVVLLLALLLQRRAWKPLRRPPPPPPPPGPGRVEDADRVALIAYPEGSQYVLPTYEEAVRSERAAAPLSEPAAGGGLAPRLHHHRSLPPAARRERLWRREQESDSVSQRSVQSHHSVSRQSNTASNATASLLDSMGSTDTMATSDAASNTLSAAATASVRGMCGSLASFDTSSVLNTEGVPLLEENETELEGVEQEDSLSCGKSSSGDAASNK